MMDGQASLRRDKAFPGLFGSWLRFHCVIPAVLCLALVWPFKGGSKVQMMAGSATPGARGMVRYKTESNGNTDLNIKVSSLARPSSLTPPKNDYVVWIQSPGQPPLNSGELRVNGKEEAELNTETPYKQFTLFITAEESPQPHAPAGPKVLSAEIAR
jgi:hypothetical protein